MWLSLSWVPPCTVMGLLECHPDMPWRPPIFNRYSFGAVPTLSLVAHSGGGFRVGVMNSQYQVQWLCLHHFILYLSCFEKGFWLLEMTGSQKLHYEVTTLNRGVLKLRWNAPSSTRIRIHSPHWRNILAQSLYVHCISILQWNLPGETSTSYPLKKDNFSHPFYMLLSYYELHL